MGEILVGTAAWTDRTLLDSGWYPPDVADNAQKRLAYYASRFPIVEVDSTFYHPPAERTAELWAERTPERFAFHVKAFSLLTKHATRVYALFTDLRPATTSSTVYARDLPRSTYEEIWARYLSALDPLLDAGKLGALLFQFPPWFRRGESTARYLCEVAERCGPRPVAIELRHPSWFEADDGAEVLTLLRELGVAYVCVDSLADHDPPPVAATSELAVVRLHGRSPARDSGEPRDRVGYTYGEQELARWAATARELAGEAERVHIFFNNCCAGNAQRDAARLTELLALPPAQVPAPRKQRRPAGDRPTGNHPAADRPARDHPAGDRPTGRRPTA